MPLRPLPGTPHFPGVWSGDGLGVGLGWSWAKLGGGAAEVSSKTRYSTGMGQIRKPYRFRFSFRETLTV